MCAICERREKRKEWKEKREEREKSKQRIKKRKKKENRGEIISPSIADYLTSFNIVLILSYEVDKYDGNIGNDMHANSWAITRTVSCYHPSHYRKVRYIIRNKTNDTYEYDHGISLDKRLRDKDWSRLFLWLEKRARFSLLSWTRSWRKSLFLCTPKHFH